METAVRQEDTPPKASRVPRRGLLAAAAWAAPTLAVATAAPAIAASPPINPLTDLGVAALGGAEGLYPTRGSYTPDPVGPNLDFRRAFSVTNTGDGLFTGSLRIEFTFPLKWNQGISGGDGNNNVDAFHNWSAVDLGGSEGTSAGSATDWTPTERPDEWFQNRGTNAWTEVWFQMSERYFTLNNVTLPPGGTIWFALNAEIPSAWIGTAGAYLPNGRRIYWRSPVSITATTSGGTNLGTYVTPVGSWENGIWYFNGGGPYAYKPGLKPGVDDHPYLTPDDHDLYPPSGSN